MHALWLSGLVYRAKSCTSVFLAGKFLTHFYGSAYHLAIKCTDKISRRKCEHEFFVTQKFTNHAALVYSALPIADNLRRSSSRTFLSRLSGLSVGAFTESNQLHGYARQWFDLVIPYVIRSVISHTSSSSSSSSSLFGMHHVSA